MGTYGLERVIQMWETGKLSSEQAIGQILLLLQALAGRVTALEKSQRRRQGEDREAKRPR